MAHQELDPSLVRLLSERIESYEQLAVLVLLVSSPEPARAETIAGSLNIAEGAVREALAALLRRGLAARATSPSSFRYAPQSRELDALVKQLVEVYRSNHLAVVQAMTESSMRRLRAAALATFAECFRLGGPKRDG